MFTSAKETTTPHLETRCQFMYHPDTLPKDTSNNFGICQITTPKLDPEIDHIDWIFNIDRSASMTEIGNDKKTKMDHIHHTLKNMIEYLTTLPTKITQTVTILSFDHEVEVICEDIAVNMDLKANIPNIIDKLVPRGSTNIGAALHTMNTQLNKKDSSKNTMHIFMSDGEVTVGQRDKKELADIITVKNENIKHAFVGYGIKHDDMILRHLSSETNGEYYFIDSMENAGMVYGEILYAGLHEHIKNMTMEIENGEYYNYQTNTWTSTFQLNTLLSGQTRTLHIRSITDDCSTKADSNTDGNAEHHEHHHHEHHHHDTHLHISIKGTYKLLNDNYNIYDIIPPDIEYPAKDCKNMDVEKFYWRQQTQEMMYKVRQFMETSPVSYFPLHQQTSLPQQECPEFSKFLEESHIMLDSAKQGIWSVVWAMLDKIPCIINSLPSTHKFNLMHHSIHQQNVFALLELLRRGADITIQTSDKLDANNIVSPENSSKEINNVIQNAYKKHYKKVEMEKNSPEKKRKELGKMLDSFLKRLKKYMQDNNLDADEFMLTLCDDVYIAIRSLTSEYGRLYIHTRSISQGRERAYNLTNIEKLEEDTTPAFRSLGGNHGVSQSNTTTYASQPMTSLMHEVSR